MVRHHPQWQTARETDRAGRIGPLTAVQAFSYWAQRRCGPVCATSPTSAAVRCTTSAATPSWSGRYLFEAEPLQWWPWWTAIRPSVPTGAPALSWTLAVGGTQTFTVSTQNCGYQRVPGHRFTRPDRDPIPFNPPPGGATHRAGPRWCAGRQPHRMDRHRAGRPVPAAGRRPSRAASVARRRMATRSATPRRRCV